MPELSADPGKLVRMRERDMQHHTYADYLIWSATSGNELVDGVAYVREPPSPSRLHQEIVVELCRQVTNSLRSGHGRAYVAPFDVRLPKDSPDDDRIDTVVQPDVLIVCDLQKLDDRGMRGAPDWIAEVLSPSTAGYDRTIKLSAYERAGVPEVWLIDPSDRSVTIHRLAAGRYTHPVVLPLRGQTAIAAVPGVGIDWDQLPAM
jgi:Uma2 family endonuclease